MTTAESAAQTLGGYRAARAKAFYWKADLPVDDAALCSLADARRQRQEASASEIARLCETALGEPPRQVEPLAGGTLHAAYRIADRRGRAFVVRTSLPELPLRSFDFHVDRWMMDLLARSGLPCVRIVAQEVASSRRPFDFQIAEAAKGRPLSSFSSDAAYPALVRRAGSALARIHSLSAGGYGALDVGALLESGQARGSRQSWSDFLLANLDGHLRACADSGTLDAARARKAESAIAKAADRLGSVPARVLHGDLGAANVFSDGQSITAVLDWEDVLSGDPVFDIAGWGSFIGHDAVLAPFLEGYGAAAALPDDLEPRYALYHLRIVLAKTVHRRRFGYDRFDRIPAQRRLGESLDRFERTAG